MGSFVPTQVEPEDPALDWVNRYRAARGYPTLAEMPRTLAEATNDDFKVHRYREDVVFTDLNDVEIGRALHKCGCRSRSYLRDPKNPESKRWDITLPSYLWDYA